MLHMRDKSARQEHVNVDVCKSDGAGEVFPKFTCQDCRDVEISVLRGTGEQSRMVVEDAGELQRGGMKCLFDFILYVDVAFLFGAVKITIFDRTGS